MVRLLTRFRCHPLHLSYGDVDDKRNSEYDEISKGSRFITCGSET